MMSGDMRLSLSHFLLVCARCDVDLSKSTHASLLHSTCTCTVVSLSPTSLEIHFYMYQES